MAGQGKRIKGKVVTWNDDKGFGFVEPMTGGKQVFVHIKAFQNRQRRPGVGDTVTYRVSTGKGGRTRAVDAVYAGERAIGAGTSKRGSSAKSPPIVIALVFLAFVALSVVAGKLPPAILLTYVVFSLLTYLLYYLDKSAARQGRWRTKESSLHLLALAGGWPGALVAQKTLRHKSRKQPFRFIFWLTVLANIGALVWFHSADGAAFLHEMLGDNARLPFPY
ncbi:DUF1294 domain-containing protein [Microbulbifer aggregans]|uniref:DUF1294 domain-containing protein n=1 Tax=Microbulbifer aggregans TaxID=1769779 RepID=UPI001CFCDCD9|nr:DUF1294 domain-containing protein [Microbulbifer aggregans]